MRRWRDLSLRSKGLVVIAVPLVPLLATLPFLIAARRAQPRLVIEVAEELGRSIREVSTLLQEAEGAMRIYVRWGGETRLGHYLEYRRALEARMDDIEGALPVLKSALAEPREGELAATLDTTIGVVPELVAESVALFDRQIERFEEAGRVEPDPKYLGANAIFVNQRLGEALAVATAQEVALKRQALQAVEAQGRRQLLTAAALALTGLVLALLGIGAFTTSIVRRIQRLEEGTRGLAQGERVQELASGNDELGRLARELAGASALLQEREQGLREAKEEADQANRAKSEFLSRMSHELRTPLNAILGFGQLLQMDGLDRQQREGVDQIVKAGRHLLDLINEVLDIARIEAGRLTLSLEPVDVDEVVREVFDLMQPLASQRNLDIGYDPAEAGARYVVADRQRLKQVLLNLVSNAVKYNRDGGRVRVATTELDGVLRIDVADTGPGIAPNRLGDLFKPFERLGADASGVEGSGLGLAVSHRLMEAMGGTLSIRSELGRGSTFSAELALVDDPGITGWEGARRGGSTARSERRQP